MKLALVCKDFTLERGGLERYTVNLSRDLVRKGHEVHVFAHHFQTEAGIIFHRVPMWRPSSPLKNLSFAFFSKKWLMKDRFDVIQSMERVWYQDIFRASDGINPVQLAERYTNPLLRRFKAIGPRRLVLTGLENRIFRKGGSRRILTNSKLVKSQIMRYYQVPAGKIAVIYNSVNLTKFYAGHPEQPLQDLKKKFGVNPDTLLLLFIGNDFRRKGLDVLLKALHKVQPLAFKLLVIGKDKKRAFSLPGLDDKVLFLGPQRRVEQFYHGCDAFVLPTRYDAFANVCLEAMACGKPVITSDTNGASELITHGLDGFVVENLDEDQLAKLIVGLKLPDLRFKIGHHAAATAQHYTRERYMAQLLALYEDIRREKLTDDRL
jgi:UDP-glucose:(heptosyl)LPS alpha-1,3-glucosyltransferase